MKNKNNFAEKKKDFTIAHENQPLPYKLDPSLDWIETELEHHLSYKETLNRIHIENKQEVTLFCPRCLQISTMRIHYMTDPYTVTKFQVVVCPHCNSHYSDRFYDSDYRLDKLLYLNDIISKYQKNSNRIIMLMRDSA